MKFTTALLALAAGANAHTLMSEFYVDGKGQGDATCLRVPMNPDTATDPVNGLDSTDMACGANGMKGVPRVCSANGGSTLTFEFREWPDDVSKGSIDISHKGPCAVYLKKVESAISDSAAGDGWFKIWDDGYDESAGQWCTEKVIADNGRLSVVIPESLQGGYYLVRPELLALHDADKSDPQFYVTCAQVFLQSSGSSLPDSASTVSIPGYVSAGDPSVTFNIWADQMALPYPIPGPAVWKPSSNGVSHVAQAINKQTEGLPADNCILTNANWCGTEVPEYSTEDGCWSASAECWKQCDTCYDSAPPTGSAHCRIWENKCQTIEDQCNAGNFNGPPDYMKDLTPSPSTIDVPAAGATHGQDGRAATSAPQSPLPTTLATMAQASLPVLSAGNEYHVVTTNVVVTVTEAPAPTGESTWWKREVIQQPQLDGGDVEMTVSTDGKCGGLTTCWKSSQGDCCSQDGECGSDMDHCGTGCQGNNGKCFWGMNTRAGRRFARRSLSQR